jgi:hypothetical protein
MSRCHYFKGSIFDLYFIEFVKGLVIYSLYDLFISSTGLCQNQLVIGFFELQFEK